MSEVFDVFISHNSHDKKIVRELSKALKDQGVKVWLDEDQLVPGRLWQDSLEKIILTTQAAAVLIGKDGLGPWEMPEMRACLSEFIKRKLPVIPVLLPGAPAKPELPLFLRSFTWIDLRDGITDNELKKLVWGITGNRPEQLTYFIQNKVSQSANQKKKIYISSTYSDLVDHLQALKMALERARFDVDIMEKYSAFDVRPLDKCLLDIEECDYYILILAWRYGFRPNEGNPSQRSITNLEYEKATQLRKPRLAFLLDPNYPWKPSLIDSDSSNPESDICKFRSQVQAELGCGIFTTPDSLAQSVLEAVYALTLNPGIVAQGHEAINRFSNEKQRSGTIKVREAKLLLIGQGKAGKTTLKRKLEDPNAPMPEPGDTTRGIEITHLDEKMPQTGEPLRINVWDFGGQDIQYYAHQFFLTGSSLYALVTNERIQDSQHLSYWLNIVEMLGKKSPVLIIQNKDGGYCKPLEREAAIRERFGNVHNRVFQTDLLHAATEPEFAALHREIVHQASRLPHVERDYLASFAELRDKLELEAKRETHCLRWDDYLSLMPELSENLMRDYANALTFLGVCQYFPDDAMLSDYVFLRPKWIIDALFALLLHPSLETTRGYFTERDTLAIWQGAKYRSMHTLLVRMMEEFELCYRVEGDDHAYILPQRLPSENQSFDWNEPGYTSVQYRYKFIPKGILTRLICRLHSRIEKDPAFGERVWCDAVIFTLPDGRGRVIAREVYNGNIIELRATGEKRAEMLNEVIRKMDDINYDIKYDNLKWEKLVPCPCQVCQTGENKHYFDFQLMVDLLEDGEIEERCPISRQKQNIGKVLMLSEVEFMLRRNETTTPTSFDSKVMKIFISYSKHDKSHKDNLLKHLSGLRDKIVTWNDRDLMPGEEWDEKIKDELNKADMVIYLVSANSMATNYIQKFELPLVEQRCLAGKCILVPIIVDFCHWSNLEFSKYNALPEKGIPITDTNYWVNENQAWLKVVQGISRILKFKI